MKKEKIDLALKIYKKGRVSLWKAGEIAGLSIWEMIEIAKKRKIDWVGLTPESIEKDIEIAKRISAELDREKSSTHGLR